MREDDHARSRSHALERGRVVAAAAKEAARCGDGAEAHHRLVVVVQAGSEHLDVQQRTLVQHKALTAAPMAHARE